MIDKPRSTIKPKDRSAYGALSAILTSLCLAHLAGIGIAILVGFVVGLLAAFYPYRKIFSFDALVAVIAILMLATLFAQKHIDGFDEIGRYISRLLCS